MPTPTSAAPTESPAKDAAPKLSASDLLTYCAHCGYSLVGEYDDDGNKTVLRCPTSNAVAQEIPAGDTAEWPESALEQLYRMCKAR